MQRLKDEYGLEKEENRLFRKFYAKNVMEFRKMDIYEKEVDDIFADFNQAINMKNQFILKNMDELEKTVDGFTLCKSKILRDFITRDLD